jgi:hypothetical protein
LFIALSTSDVLQVAMKKKELLTSYSGIGVIRTISIISAQLLFSYIWLKGRLLKFNYFDIILILFIFFVLASSAEKGLILLPIIYVIIIEHIISEKKYLKKNIFLYALLLLSLAVVYFLFMGDNDGFISLIFERIVVAQTIATYLSLDYYSINNYIGFASMDNSILRMFDNRVELRSSEIFVEYYPGLELLGAVNVNGVYIHEAYSNFGVLGVLVSPFFYAFSFILIYNLISPSNLDKLSLFRTSFLVYFSTDIVNLATSFNYMLFSTKTVLVFLIFFLGLVTCRLIKKVR